MPPNRHKRAIIPDSLLPNIRKKQLTQDMTLDPADKKERGIRMTLSHIAFMSISELYALIRLTYPASLNAQFCPLIELTRCCQATPPTCQGSWQSISCRHCWSHRWSRACSPPCCGGTCCWPIYNWPSGIWTNLMKEKKGGTEREREVLLVWDLWIPEELIDINKTVQLPQGMGFWNHISVPLTFTVSFSNGGCSGCMQPERRIGDTQ